MAFLSKISMFMAFGFLATITNGFLVPEGQSIVPAVPSRSLKERPNVELANKLDPSKFFPPSSSSFSRLSMIAEATDVDSLQFLFNSRDFWVFLAGVFPFAWATVEFFRRIAVGESFGTGSDSVIIGMDDSPADSRGRRVLGKGALVIACVLFTVAFGAIVIALYSVISSGAPPETFPTQELSQTVVESVIEN